MIFEKEMTDGILPDKELIILEKVYNKFADFGLADISYSYEKYIDIN